MSKGKYLINDVSPVKQLSEIILWSFMKALRETGMDDGFYFDQVHQENFAEVDSLKLNLTVTHCGIVERFNQKYRIRTRHIAGLIL